MIDWKKKSFHATFLTEKTADSNRSIGMADKKRKESKCSHKGFIWAYATLTLVSLGILLYMKQIVLPRQEHEFASFLIKIASQNIMKICEEVREIELQRTNLELAKELGDRELIEAYQRQIKDRQARMQSQVSDYQEIMLKLGGFKENIVNFQFTAHAEAFMNEKSFSRVHAVRMVRTDYKRLAGSKNNMDIEMIRQMCKENLVKF